MTSAVLSAFKLGGFGSAVLSAFKLGGLGSAVLSAFKLGGFGSLAPGEVERLGASSSDAGSIRMHVRS